MKAEQTRRVLHSGFCRQWRRKDLVPLASATRIHSLFACTTSITLPSWCGCSARQCHWRIWHLKSNHSHWIFQHGEALAVIILALSVQQLPVCLIKQQLFPLLSSPLLCWNFSFGLSQSAFWEGQDICQSNSYLPLANLSGRLTSAPRSFYISQGSAAAFPLLPRMKSSWLCGTMFVFKQSFLQQIILYQHTTFFSFSF